MPKSFVGGTVELKVAQRFRLNAKDYYGDNQSEALEAALACLNDHVGKGEVPRVKRDVTTEFTYTKVKP